jgi:uncharacterized caspase-like protein
MACIARILVLCCAVYILGIASAEARRVALVIGNAAYKTGPLANPVNDATAVAEALNRQLQFDKVILKRNLTFDGFRAALIEMAREAAGAELGLVYFAGHGIEAGGRNFLIPVDATVKTASALDVETIPLDTVLSQLSGVKRLKLVILDACRNNPYVLPGAKRSVGRGLARIEPEDNTLVVYAAKDGTTADDGVGRRHSPFTEALLKHIATPGLEINLLFRRVRDDVIKATSHEAQPQQPHVYASLGGQELFLSPPSVWAPAVQPSVAAPSPPPASDAERAWVAAKDSTSIAVLEAFRRQYGASNAFYDRLAQARLEELKKQAALATPPAAKPPLPEMGPAVSPPLPKAAPDAGAPTKALSAEMKCCVDFTIRLDANVGARKKPRSEIVRECEFVLKTYPQHAWQYRDPKICAGGGPLESILNR